jgi:signal transduction histidine kinase
MRAIRGTLARNVAVDARAGGLDGSLRALAERLCEGTGTAWSVEVAPEAAPADATLLYSLARELVTNAVKHARAEHLVVRVQPSAGGVRLEVADDGVGFDPAAGARPGHVGLALVAHRARTADGRLEIRSHPGDGTRITLEVPGAAQ